MWATAVTYTFLHSMFRFRAHFHTTMTPVPLACIVHFHVNRTFQPPCRQTLLKHAAAGPRMFASRMSSSDSSSSDVPPFDPKGCRFDLDTFSGRLAHFREMVSISPFTLRLTFPPTVSSEGRFNSVNARLAISSIVPPTRPSKGALTVVNTMKIRLMVSTHGVYYGIDAKQ